MAVEPQKLNCSLAEACGACDLHALNYKSQLIHKGTTLKSLLGLTSAPNIIPSAVEGFRHRALFRVHVDHGTVKVGYFSAGTRDLLPIPRCEICSSSINRFLAYCADANLVLTNQFRCRLSVLENGDRVDVFINFVTKDPSDNELFVEWLAKSPTVGTVSAEDTAFLKDPVAKTLLNGLVVHSCAAAFSQTNPQINEKVQQEIGTLVLGGHHLLDLYCGNGNFGLGLLDKFDESTFCEASPMSVELLEKSLRGSPYKTNIIRSTVEKFVAKAVSEGQQYDCIIVDPPKSGLQNVAKHMERICTKLLIYVSCSPESLGKDSEILKENFELLRLSGVDMFPHTSHMECLAVFSRKNGVVAQMT